MTAAKGLLELYINLNLTLIFALALWLLLRAVLARTGLANAHRHQYNMIRGLFFLIILTPGFAWLAQWATSAVSPGTSLALSDAVVAAFLRGNLGASALEFEAVLNARNTWEDAFLSAQSPFLALLAFGLVAGFAIAIARFATSMVRLNRTLKDAYVWKRHGTLTVHLSDTVTIPFAARGLFRRHIVLPTDLLLRRTELRIAMAHELQHFRQADLEWQLIVEAARPLFFWNPAYFLLKRQFERLRELSCDATVLAKHAFRPLDYARCLLDMCERSVGKRSDTSKTSVALVSAGRRSARAELMHRLLSLRTPGSERTRRLPVWTAGCVMVVALTIFGAAIQPTSGWSQDRLTLSTVINLERFAAYRGF